jgi:nitrogen fixation/metabolism regulation signal transduction histidine kinase
MKKMYSNKPVVDKIEIDTAETANMDDKRRIKFLEDRVRQLSEQMNRMASALALTSRQIRRQNTDIHNVNTVLRNK